MTRHFFFAIALIGTGVLLNSPAAAAECNVRTVPRIAWADVPTGQGGQATGAAIRTNVCLTATGG